VTAPAVETPVEAARRAARECRLREPALWTKLAVLAAFALVPAVAPSFQVVDLALKIAIFAALVASYDVLLGYTGIVSFGHAMFFGFGAYAVALVVGTSGTAGYGRLAVGFLAGVTVSLAISLLVSAFSLRVKAIFFAMITLAFAEFALILAVQLSQVTGGEDGVSPRFPGVFAPAFSGRLLGLPLTGRLVTYYAVLALALALFLLMSRFVASPLGRTLQAIRDNELRAEALGLPTFVFQSIASAFASVVATLLGGGYVLWVRYVNPESSLGIHIMLDILLMVIIGGIGTLWGGIIGAAVLLSAQALLPNLRALGAALFPARAARLGGELVGAIGLAVRDRRSVVTLDLTRDPQIVLTDDLRRKLALAPYRAALAVPLIVQDQVIGALLVGDQAGRAFTTDEVQLAQTFGDHAAAALENARLHEEKVILAHEEERRRITYDLHDGIAQLVVGAKQRLDTCQDFWHSDPRRAEQELTRGVEHLSRAIVEMRRVLRALRPTPLDSIGLVGAIRQSLSEATREAGWTVGFSENLGDVRFPATVETAVFRIVQEALANALRHAKASRLDVELHQDGHTLRLDVRDNGLGFGAIGEPGHSRGLGLLSMRERATLLGGSCTIVSEPGQGTRICVEVPLQGRHSAGPDL
jgi:branched-chain amino acid transport system permease protein